MMTYILRMLSIIDFKDAKFQQKVGLENSISVNKVSYKVNISNHTPRFIVSKGVKNIY